MFAGIEIPGVRGLRGHEARRSRRGVQDGSNFFGVLKNHTKKKEWKSMEYIIHENVYVY
jgi:hypothetical protein